MGSSGVTSVVSSRTHTATSWLNLDSRRKKLTLLTSLLMSMTSRVMAKLMPFMQEISSVPAISTPPSEPSRRLVDSQRRERRCCPRLMFSPCTRRARTPRTRVGFHDFVEILKLYDKNNDNTMIGNELFGLLTNLGEKLTKEEAKGLMKELCEPEDEDGFMPFIPFLEKMCAAEK